jgi:hypothetical protein
MEAAFATHFQTPAGGANYAEALAIIMLVVFALVAVLAKFGYERHSVDFAPVAASGLGVTPGSAKIDRSAEAAGR